MKLNEDDIKKFYALYIRYNTNCFNIGVVGDSRKFKKYTSNAIKQFKDSADVIIKNDKIVRILDDDIEYCYIQIEDTDDLKGKYFRKFV